MDEQIRVRCTKAFKDDVQEAAAKKNMTMATYLREAARRQMQRDIAVEAKERD